MWTIEKWFCGGCGKSKQTVKIDNRGEGEPIYLCLDCSKTIISILNKNYPDKAEEKKCDTMTTLELFRLGQAVYPIMLAQQAGEISESKAVELLGMNHEKYREAKQQTIDAVLKMVTSLPSPLCLLLKGIRDQQK